MIRRAKLWWCSACGTWWSPRNQMDRSCPKCGKWYAGA